MYRVWLEELPRTENWLGTPGGFYNGHKHNWPIYSRHSTGISLNKAQAIRVIEEARNSGYKCRAEPSFSITINY